MRLAEVIVHSLAAAHLRRMVIAQFFRENELLLTETGQSHSPDGFLQLRTVGMMFNVMLELDNGTEPLEGEARSAIEKKLDAYEAHQDAAIRWWQGAGSPLRTNRRFRVVFLTKTAQRAEHIVQLAGEIAKNRDRRLCYAATQEAFLIESDALCQPLFIDHHGHWQALVNVHPSSHVLRTPVRFAAT